VAFHGMAVEVRSEWCVSMGVAADSRRHTPDQRLSNASVYRIVDKLHSAEAQLHVKAHIVI
jgi:hypothetical protein